MKSIFAFFAVFSILLMASFSYARKDVGEYWNSIMKDQPMPEAIRDLFHDQDPPSLTASTKQDRFVRNFDVRPNAIIYHGHSLLPEGENSHKPSVHNHHKELQEPAKQISRD